MGKNAIRGPKMIVVNVALSRKFPVRETQYVEFRAEAYNLPNLVNFALSTSSTLMTSACLMGVGRVLENPIYLCKPLFRLFLKAELLG